MKQSISLNLILSFVFMIILCIIGLTLCVEWNIGGYCPLTIVVCTIGVTLLAAYADKVEQQEQQEVNLLLSQAFIAEVEQQVHVVHHQHSTDGIEAEFYEREEREFDF